MILKLNEKERNKVKVISKVVKKKLTKTEAASLLSLSTRQIRRLIKLFELEGPRGFIHKGRGQPSHNRKPEELRLRILNLIRTNYRGQGASFLSRVMLEKHEIKIGKETLRKWLAAEGLSPKQLNQSGAKNQGVNNTTRPPRPFLVATHHIGEADY